MKQNLFTLMTFALSISALTFVVSCGEDEEVVPNTQQNGNQNGQGDQQNGGEKQDEPPAPIIVTVDADGKADGGHNFTMIDNANFYIDDIKYTASQGELQVSGYNDALFKGEAKIISQLNYGGRELAVKRIGYEAFKSCKALTSVNIPSSVTSIGGAAFFYCTALTSVTILEGVAKIDNNAFYNCIGLTDVTIPASVTNIGESAFSGCNRLTNVHITNLESWLKISFPLYSAHHLYLNGEEIKDLVIPSSVKSIGKFAFCGCASITSVTIPSSVISIGECAFWGCKGLTSVTIPSSVTNIGDKAFNECTGLTSVTIPSSVTSIGTWAFSDLKSVTINSNSIVSKNYPYNDSNRITIQGLNDIFGREVKNYNLGENVTGIGNHAFWECDALTTISIPSSVTHIGNDAFYGCTGLTSITVAEGNPKYDSRNNCNAIIETRSNNLIKGCNNTIIPSSVKSIGERAFCGCKGLTSVSIPEGVTIIDKNAFNECRSLTTVTIPSSVTNIGESAFQCCYDLTSVTIPEGVTTIEKNAFYATALTTVDIPSSVTQIGEYAFWGSSYLKDVYCYAETPPNLGNKAFDTTKDRYGQEYYIVTLHVPSSAIEVYRSTNPWWRFEMIVAIE